MAYEEGMQIIWDVMTRSVVVIFRKTVIDLPGPFRDQHMAIAAAEERCRQMGWAAEEATPVLPLS